MKGYGHLNKRVFGNYHDHLGGGGAAEVPIPSESDVIFQWDLYDGGTTPQVGSITYTRSGTIAVPTGQYTWTKYTTDQVPVGAVRHEGSETLSGAYLSGSITNYLVRSEEFGTTWTTVGTGSVTDNTDDGPFGASSDADTISGSASGDGVEQSPLLTAASRSFVFSVFLRATSGSPTVTLTVQDAGSEGGHVEVTLTQNWVRYQVPHTFTSSASGNIKAQILVGLLPGFLLTLIH